MDRDQVYTLIGKELKGEASGEETDRLNQWKDQTPSNLHLYREILKIWEKYASWEQEIPVDALESWNSLERRIEREKSVPKERWILGPAWRVAASITITLAVGLGLYWYWNATALQTFTTGNEKSEPLTLVDGSVVWLSRNSTLQYPKTFTSDTRMVKLVGQAYFQVEGDKNLPFVIQSPYGSEVTVLGTEFNYLTQPDSSVLSVTEGIVRMVAGENEVILGINEEALFRDNHIAKRPSFHPNRLAWKTGVLQFTEIPIAALVRKLEDHYQVDIALKIQSTTQCTLSATFDNQELTEVLDEISLVFALKWKQNGVKNYLVEGESCQ